MNIVDGVRAYLEAQKIKHAPGVPLIVYLENSDEKGVPIVPTIGAWDDWRILIDLDAPTPEIIGQWKATTSASKTGIDRQKAIGGAARLAYGFHRKGWKFGFHKRNPKHPALIQAASLRISRDLNGDGLRENDKTYFGWYGTNQHTTFGDPSTVGLWSLGCLVGWKNAEHAPFLNFLRQAKPVKMNPQFLFDTLIIDPATEKWTL